MNVVPNHTVTTTIIKTQKAFESMTNDDDDDRINKESRKLQRGEYWTTSEKELESVLTAREERDRETEKREKRKEKREKRKEKREKRKEKREKI
jgi:penicillin-binding protein 2A